MVYLYDSEGEWIAVKKGIYLYNKEGQWIGWFPSNDKVAVDIDGEYLATIYQKDRLLVNSFQGMIMNAGFVNRPFGLGFISKPMEFKSKVIIAGTRDVSRRDLKL